MAKKNWICIFWVMLVVIIASCGTQLYIPHQDTGLLRSDTSITLNDLTEGRSLYVNACGGCHYLHYPKDFTIAEWQDIYPEMKTRVHLKEESLNKIYYYLVAGASDAGINDNNN